MAAESGAANTIDPLAGSYVIEKLTDEIEAKAREYLEKIDAMGGMVRAIERHFQGAVWQRCQVHFVRNALALCGRQQRPMVLRLMKTVTESATRAAATPGPDAAPELVVGRLRVNTGAHIAMLDDQLLELTPVEFALLASLARARGRVKSREQLLEEIRDRNFDVFDRSIDVHISALRKKLGDDPKEPQFIRTVRAVGYMLINPDAP